MFGNVTVDKPKTLAMLAERGITKVVIEFSGGNDEGGAESTTATLADGTEIPVNQGNAHQEWRTQEWVVGFSNKENNRYETRPATEAEIAESELAALLEAPVYGTYGSFAGVFSVEGILTWDVEAGTCTMMRSEYVYADSGADDLDF